MSRAPEKIGRLFTLDMRLNLCLIDIFWLDPIPKIDAYEYSGWFYTVIPESGNRRSDIKETEILF